MTKFASFLRRHLGAFIAGTATAVVLAGGLLILTSGGGGGAPAAAGNTPTTPTTLARSPTTPGAGAAARHLGVRGQVTAISGTTWTVMSARGAPVTVDVSPATTFGTKAAPLTSSDFAVGDQIVVLGTRTKATVSATRIAKAPTGATATPTTGGT